MGVFSEEWWVHGGVSLLWAATPLPSPAKAVHLTIATLTKKETLLLVKMFFRPF